MALPDPIEMPQPLPVNSKLFELSYNQNVSPAGSHFSQTIERAKPSWIAKYDTPALTPERLMPFQAFLDALEGSMNAFLAFDPRRPRPWAYRGVGGEPWLRPGQAAVQVTAGDYANSTISLRYFADGAIISYGDYISHKIGKAWYLYRSKENRVVPSGGVVSNLKVNLRPINFSGQAYPARLVRACCAMKVVGSVSSSDNVEDVGPKYSFTAGQFIDRSL